ncbi:MAG TPA: DUF1080 domain-containing protein [Tepidisphaeraceae bacterium]|jgi:hypothetical protein
MDSKTSCLAILVILLVLAHLARGADNELTPQEKADGWLLLFDGRSMDGWRIGEDPIPAANVKDGAFNPRNMAGGRKLYVCDYTARKFADFVLALDFKITPKCNSGVFFRVTDPADPVQSGFEIQIYDSGGKAKVGKHDSGALYDAREPSANAARPAGEWQHVEITAKGAKIEVVLNGRKVMDANLDDWKEAGKNPDGTANKFKSALKDMPRSGYVGLQDHLSDLWFKNVKIKPLKP